jgi:hypothetical protein
MNKRQVIILWVIALALGAAVTIVKTSQNKATQNATKRTQGQTLFESFPATEAASVLIQSATDNVTLVKKDGTWTVSERDSYPANNTYVNDLIRTLGELKVTVAMEAGPSFAPRFGMDESATKPEDRGLTATFKDAGGKELAKVSLGKNIESGAAQSPMGGGNAVGRYIRNHADESGFYAISEMFPAVTADPKAWLNSTFINPEKIQSITLSQVGKTDPAWTLTRETEEAEFKLQGATGSETLDTAVTSPLKTLFSYARFEDVVPAAKVTERAAAEGKRTATIVTFEGFTYTLTMTPTKPGAPAAPASPEATPPATDNYLLTVAVTAELPKERKKEESEKPEDAKTKDTAFSDRLKALTEKLTKEKALANISFEVPKTLLDPVLKERDALLTKPAAPAAPANPSAGNVQELPGGMIARPGASATTPPIEAVTPPISVPPAEE